jgi:predicted glycoside hydrolase/deacetylase ChbG (UPF0249 family)
VNARVVIFNADDFGYSRGINRGIAESHLRGVVTSTSLMVNTPATEDAVALSRDLPALSVGLHVNFTNEAQRLVDFYAPGVARDELRRQLERFLALMGRLPTHLDSHQHVHRLRECRAAFDELAAEHGLHLRDAPPVVYKGGFYGQWEYGVSDPTKVSVAALEAILRRETPPGVYEMCVHPGRFDPDFESVYHRDRESELATLTDPRVRAILEEEGIRLIGYRDLAAVLAELGESPRSQAPGAGVAPLRHRLTLDLFPERYAVCRLPADRPWPSAPQGSGLYSLTRDAEWLSVVCAERELPDGAQVENGWRAVRVRGPLDFGLVGILADLTSALANARISLFALSTFETDWLLVRDGDLEGALAALRAAGHTVHA